MRRIGVLIAVLAFAAAACKSGGGGVETVANSEPTLAPTVAEAEATEVVEPTATSVPPTEAPAEPTESPAEFTELTALLSQSSLALSGRLEGSMTIAGIPGAPSDFTMTFSGTFDNVNGNSSMKMDMSGIAALLGDEVPPGFEDFFGEMEMLIIGEAAYMKFPFFSELLGAETEWVAISAEDAGSTVSGFSGGISPANPTDSLALFSQSFASVTNAGRESVRGVDTTHYVVVIDMERLFETATPLELAELEAQGPLPFDELPMEYWIGDDGLIYRYRMDMAGDSLVGPTGAQSFGTMTMVVEMFDYGAAIDVVPPPADQVTDISELGGLFGF